MALAWGGVKGTIGEDVSSGEDGLGGAQGQMMLSSIVAVCAVFGGVQYGVFFEEAVACYDLVTGSGDGDVGV